DAADRRVGMRRAQKKGVELAREMQIVGVAPGAGQEADIFLAPDRLADTVFAHSLLDAKARLTTAAAPLSRARTGDDATRGVPGIASREKTRLGYVLQGPSA